MKRIFILLAVAGAATGSRADLTLQQQIVTPNYNGVTTMKIKGTKVRMDLYAGEPQAQSSITDLNTGETISLMHAQKLFLKSPGPSMNQSKPAGATSSAPLPRATGKTQKVGDYDTELYTWSNARGIAGTAWVAKNFPDYARIRNDLAILDKMASTDNDTSPELNTLPGMVVRSQVSGGGQTITLALISAKETPLDASSFAIPRDYKEVPRPKPLKLIADQPAPSKSSGNATQKTAPQKTTPVAAPKTASQQPPPW